MILGLSLIFAFLSYLIYRHLLPSQASDRSSSSTGVPSNRAPRLIPMWPFWSTLLHQSAPPSPSHSPSPPPQSTPAIVGPSGTAKRLTPPTVVVVAPAPVPAAASPDTTPKPTPETPTIHIDAIPQISLSIPNVSTTVEDEDDYVPSFPSLNSAQRASSGTSSLTPTYSNPASKPPTISMPPPPIPIRGRNPKASVRYAVPASPPSTATVLRQNPNGAARPRLAAMGVGASGVAAGNGLNLPNSRGQASGSKSRKKVILEPGHSPLDWARLQRSGIDLRGLPHSNLIKVSPSLLAKHSKAPEDVWTALHGRVYNITAYLPFHPGGEKDLLRGAGKDSTKLFNATHPWVNVEGMLAECLIGISVSEEEAAASTNGESGSTLDTMD